MQRLKTRQKWELLLFLLLLHQITGWTAFFSVALGPCRNCFRLCWKLLRIQMRKSKFHPSSHPTCEVLWTGSCPCPSLGLHPRLGNAEWLGCSVLVSGALQMASPGFVG